MDYLGLIYGLSCVSFGQLIVLLYYWNSKIKLQTKFNYWEYMNHLKNPGGFLLLGTYLTVTWTCKLLPKSYYNIHENFSIFHVFLQLLLTDFLQYCFHIFEHKCKYLYMLSHKSHHLNIYPKITDSFKGSIIDTIVMILTPLFITSQITHCNTWSYIIFGTIYANDLCLIHNELDNPWDPFFKKLGFGTASDHRIHHALFRYNCGHIFTYWDRIFGTYRNK